MAAGSVRRLRISQPSSHGSGIDTISNPQLLAHQLLRLDFPEEAHLYSRRLRLSNIADSCVRERLLGLRNSVMVKSVVDMRLRVTFDLGNGIHEFLQNHPGYFGKQRLGWWRCGACGHGVFGRRPAKSCKICKALPEASRYAEHSLSLPEDIPVSGHPDNFLEVAPGDIRIMDFKSITGEEFKRLSAPRHEHAMQVNGYMEYIQYDKTLPVKINPNRGLVLYVSKNHIADSLPFKAFHVERTAPLIQFIRDKVADFKKGLEDEEFLPHPLTRCSASNFQSSVAKVCPVVSFCSQLCT